MSTKAALIIKIIFVVLIVFIVVEVVLGLRNLKQPVSTQLTASSNTLQSKSGAKIALVSEKTKYQVGENINVALRIFTGGNSSDGTDVIISYDTSFLEINVSGINTGNIFGDYPLISVSQGKVAVSGIATGNVFNGIGVLANLNFKAKQTGKTNLLIDYTSGKTTDSNIIETNSGKDILDQVTNLDLVIDNNGSQATPDSCGERVYTECADSLGKSGSFWCTNIVDGFSCSLGCFKEKAGNDLGCKVI